MSLRISCSGLPLSRESSRASSSPRSATASAKAFSAAARSWASAVRQPGAARLAAVTATSTSRSSQRGIWPMTVPVAGSTTSRVAPETAVAASPSTRIGCRVGSTGPASSSGLWLAPGMARARVWLASRLAGRDRVVVGTDAHVDQHALPGAGRRGGGLEHFGQLLGVADLAGRGETEGAGQAGQVWIRVGDGLADPGIGHRAAALAGDPPLVDYVVVEGGVVGHHDQ